MRQFLRMCLAELKEAQIDEAGDGMQALKLLTDQHYELLLLDLNIPLLDGLKVLTALRQQPQGDSTRVVVITTAGDDETRRRIEALGGYFLAKPARAFELRALVRSLLGVHPNTSPEAERRKAPRLQVAIKVEFAGVPALELSTEDVSALGAFLISDTLFAVGSRGVVTLHFPHLPKPLSVECRVVHVRASAEGDQRPGFGVRFEPESDALREELMRAFTSPSVQA